MLFQNRHLWPPKIHGFRRTVEEFTDSDANLESVTTLEITASYDVNSERHLGMIYHNVIGIAVYIVYLFIRCCVTVINLTAVPLSVVIQFVMNMLQLLMVECESAKWQAQCESK